MSAEFGSRHFDTRELTAPSPMRSELIGLFNKVFDRIEELEDQIEYLREREEERGSSQDSGS